LFDVGSGKIVTFVDGLYNDALDGQFRDIVGKTAVELKLLNSSGAIVSDPFVAAKAVLNRSHDLEEHFEVLDFDPSSSIQLSGRLIRKQDRDGHFLQVAYKSWTPTVAR
jgi:hypothetical protein